MIGTSKYVGKMASAPYTSSYGEVPIDLFVHILSAHKAYLNFKFQAFLFYCNTFLMILTMLLLEDSTRPVPYG